MDLLCLQCLAGATARAAAFQHSGRANTAPTIPPRRVCARAGAGARARCHNSSGAAAAAAAIAYNSAASDTSGSSGDAGCNTGI